MHYRVKFVDDELLVTKSGRQQDWAVGAVRCTAGDCASEAGGPAGGVQLADAVERVDLMMVCLIRRTVRRMSDEDAEAVLELAWQGFRDLVEGPPDLVVQIV